MGNDPRFNSENFARQPLTLVTSALQALNQWEKRTINANSIATAKVGGLIAMVCSSEETSPPDEYQFLPFPPEEQEGPDEVQQPSSETIAILKTLISSGRLPKKAFAAFNPEIRKYRD